VPWYIGTETKIRPANKSDINEGKKYLLDLICLLPALRIIVLGGLKAQKAETLLKAAYPDITIIKMPHPSPLFVNNAPGNKLKILRILNAVKELLLEK
jgi:uracil DNA glycosylase